MKHLTWAIVTAHIDIVMRISEEASSAGASQYLAIVYDDLVRRDWAGRPMKRDPALNIPIEAMINSKEIYEVAKTRLSQVLDGAGVASESGAGQWKTQINSSGILATSLHANAESSLAKQQAAAEAVTKRAEAATKAMATPWPSNRSSWSTDECHWKQVAGPSRLTAIPGISISASSIMLVKIRRRKAVGKETKEAKAAAASGIEWMMINALIMETQACLVYAILFLMYLWICTDLIFQVSLHWRCAVARQL